MRDLNPPGHGGCILNITSIGGYVGNATLSYYCAGKFGKWHPILSSPTPPTLSYPVLEGFTEALSKEMVPAWNIRAVIVQPGGFRTEWAGSSMLTFPLPPPYDRADAPSVRFRELLGQSHAMGDPRRAAVALMQVATMADPPLRVQLGTDAVLLVRGQALKTARESERYEELAHSTNAEGVDRERMVALISAGTGAN